MTPTCAEFCRLLDQEMKSIKKLAESKNISPEMWEQIDSLAKFVETIGEEIPKLDEWFDDLQDTLEKEQDV